VPSGPRNDYRRGLWRHAQPLSEDFSDAAMTPVGQFVTAEPTKNYTQKEKLCIVQTDSSGDAGTSCDE
jgi:hypothetical protein